MARVAPLISNFTSGEIDPRCYGRVDIAKYFNSACTLENIVVSDFGSASKRPGTYFVSEVKDSTRATRLIKFQFNTEQAYIIEMGNLYMRFYTDQGQIVKTLADTANWVTSTGYVVGNFVEQGSALYYCVTAHTSGTFSTDLAAGKWVAQEVYEIVTPYTYAQVFDVQFAQSNDVMYLTHPSHPQQKLSRTGHSAWTIESVVFEGGPFLPINKTAMTMDASDVTGTITVTASSAYFTTAMQGMLMKIHATVGTPGVQGYVKFTTRTSDTVMNATVMETLSAHTATDEWALGAWGASTGYPSCVGFYEQRIAYANTPSSKPQTVWLSVSEEYENFTNGSDDTDGMTWTIASGEVNEIRWLSPSKVLGLGTSGGVFSLSSGSDSTPLTPSNVLVQLETRFGVAEVQPRQIDNYTYYVQRNGKIIREFAYEFAVDTFNAKDMNLIAAHVTGDSITDEDYQQSPHNMIWCVRSDGVIATMTRQVDQEVLAWARLTTDGLFESVAIVPEDTNGYDEVWVAVNRTIGGVTKRYVEYFVNEDWGADQEDCFFVDSGLTYDSTPTSTITGLDHLNGKTVDILADGAVHPSKVVGSGQIMLDYPASVVHVGLPYTATIKTINLEAGSQNGTAQGKTKRIFKVTVRFYKSLGCTIGWSGQMDTLSFRDSSMDMNAPPPLFTGDKSLAFPHGWDKDAHITITQAQPLPLTVLCVMPLMYTTE